MDLKQLFQSASDHLRAEFKKSSQITHKGEKGAQREDSLRDALRSVLPAKYGLGSGEVVTVRNEVSRQSDVIIFDSERGLQLLHEESHGLYPIESVYGTIAVKSDLTHAELEDAYENITSVKRLVPPGAGFEQTTHSGAFVSHAGVAAPVPVGIVFAFTASRSLEAIADQIAELDAKLDHLRNRPDFVVIFDQGIVGPKVRVRDDFNSLKLPPLTELHHIHKSGRHTLLRFIIQILDELTPMILPPLDLRSYLRVPDRIGQHLVSGHDRLVRGDERNRVWKLGPNAIRKILDYCGPKTPVLYKEVLRMQFGDLQLPGLLGSSMHQQMKVYDPEKLPPFDPSKLITDKDGRPVYDGPRFNPVFVRIDGNVYAVELSALDDDDWIERTDVDIDELLDEDQLIAAFKQEKRRIVEQFSKKA